MQNLVHVRQKALDNQHRGRQRENFDCKLEFNHLPVILLISQHLNAILQQNISLHVHHVCLNHIMTSSLTHHFVTL